MCKTFRLVYCQLPVTLIYSYYFEITGSPEVEKEQRPG